MKHIWGAAGNAPAAPAPPHAAGAPFMAAVALLVAAGFSSTFLLPHAIAPLTGAFQLVYGLSEAAAVIAAAWWSYRNRTGLRSLIWWFVPLLGTGAIVSALHVIPPFPLAPILGGAAAGTTLVLAIAMLSLVPGRWVRAVAIGGHGIGVFISLGVYNMGTVAAMDASAALLAVFLLGSAAIASSAGRGGRVQDSARQAFERYGGMRGFAAGQLGKAPSLVMLLLLSTAFMFIAGIYFGYTRFIAYPYGEPNAIVLLSFVSFAVMLAFALAAESALWYSVVFTATLVAGVLGMLAVLVSPAHVYDVLGLVNLLLSLAMTGVSAYTAETARANRIPALFGASTAPLLALCLFEAGLFVSCFLHGALPAGTYSLEVAASLALACIGTVALVLLAVLTWHLSESGRRQAPLPPAGASPAAARGAASPQPLVAAAQADAAEPPAPVPAPASGGQAPAPAAGAPDIRQRLMEEFSLTQREVEVTMMFAAGRSARFIAEDLVVAESTVKTHLKRSYVKLDVHNRQSLISLIESYSDD